MKLLIIVNNITDTFEECIRTRDLSAEEIKAIYDLVGHGQDRTVHYVDSGDVVLPYTDIYAYLSGQSETTIVYNEHTLVGKPIKHEVNQ